MPRLCVNGIELYYEVKGKGEPLLFIHGLGSSTRDWEPQVSYFSEQYRVITFDVRGHGRSEKPRGPYSVSRFADDTAELINALDTGPCHIIGISMGGMIALQLAGQAPELVRSLVVVNCLPSLVLRSVADRLQLLKRFLVVRFLGMERLGQLLGKKLFPAPDHADLRQTFVKRWAENDPSAYREAMKALVNWNISGRLSLVQCPVLVVAAENDYTPVADKETFAARLDRAELYVIKGAHHAVTMECPEEFNRIVNGFLTGLQSRT